MRWGPPSRDSTSVRDGTSPCYDRVVIDIAGPIPGGYHVAYVAQVRGEATGFVIPTPGGARLQLTRRATPPTSRWRCPVWPGSRRCGRCATLAPSRARPSFGVGVRARLPFRVLTLPGPGTHSQLVLDAGAHAGKPVGARC